MKKNKYSPITFGEFKTSQKVRDNVNKVLDSNWLTMGEGVKKLESKWCQLFNYPYARAVNSGTSALIACFLSLYEFGAKRGDFVICPALSFIATANAIRAAGFEPLFVDVELETLNINVDKLRDAVKQLSDPPKSPIAAICAVNLMGRPCDYDKITEIATEFDIPIISDSCESYGAKYKEKYILDYSLFEVSSHFSAHIAFSVEGGMVSCINKNFADLIDSIRSHGRPANSLYFDHERFGLNLKQTDLHAAVGLAEFSQFHSSFNKRKKILNELIEYSTKYSNFAIFNLPDDDVYYSAPHAYNLVIRPFYEFFYPAGIKTRTIDYIKGTFDKYNIQWKRTFGSMPTQHKCFEYLGYQLGDFPNAEYIGLNSIHLGCHKYITRKDLQRIKLALDEAFQPLLTNQAVDYVNALLGLNALNEAVKDSVKTMDEFFNNTSMTRGL